MYRLPAFVLWRSLSASLPASPKVTSQKEIELSHWRSEIKLLTYLRTQLFHNWHLLWIHLPVPVIITLHTPDLPHTHVENIACSLVLTGYSQDFQMKRTSLDFTWDSSSNRLHFSGRTFTKRETERKTATVLLVGVNSPEFCNKRGWWNACQLLHLMTPGSNHA